MQFQRRHDLDWLRIIVFSLLIIYHLGMFFVPWGWHIKNNVIYDWLKYPMIALNQWRLPILFLISGMGTRFALSKRTANQYLKERFTRLLLPLFAGMILIIPPQIYFERLFQGTFIGSYLDFYLNKAFVGLYPEGNISWNHLWFLPYLFIFSILLCPLFVWLRDHPENAFIRRLIGLLRYRFGLFLFLIPLIIIEGTLAPHYPVRLNLIGDWYALAYYFSLFFYGFVLVSLGTTVWQAIDRLKTTCVWIAIIVFSIQIFLWNNYQSSFGRDATIAILKLVYMWSCILAILGFAAKYLSKPSRYLPYLNEAVYPLYIFHQTVIIIIGYSLINWKASFFLKFPLMLILTITISFILFEFFRRINVLRIFFGMKGKYKKNKA